jgi:hypothetical protein
LINTTKTAMNRDAAMMAAQSMRPAPMVPVTNTSMPNKNKKVSRVGPASMAPTPAAQGFSAQQQNSDAAQGMMNVTGPGQRANRASAVAGTPVTGVVGGGKGTWNGAIPGGIGVDGVRRDAAGPQPGHNPDGTPVADAEADPTSVAMQKAIDDLLSRGVRDTAEEERLIQEEMRRGSSQGQADLMARLGASGFGTSGAASAMLGDINSRAALNAAKMVQDVRSGARSDQLEELRLGLGAGSDDRRLDMSEDQYTRYLQVLESIFGPDGGSGQSGSGGPDIGGITTGWGDSPSTATAGGSRQVVNSPPAGYRLYQTLSNGDQLWISPTDPGDNSTVVIVKGR